MLFHVTHSDVSILVTRKGREINRPPTPAEQNRLLQKVKAGSRPPFSWTKLDEDALHLIVKVNKKLPKQRASITANVHEGVKWVAIKKYMFKNTWLFPVLRVVCAWVFNSGLVAGRIYFLPDYLIPLLFIDHCLKRQVFGPINAVQSVNSWKESLADPRMPPLGTPEEWERFLSSIKEKSTEALEGLQCGKMGKYLCSFMHEGKALLKSEIHPELRQVFLSTIFPIWGDTGRALDRRC